jgi:hypothetical protein
MSASFCYTPFSDVAETPVGKSLPATLPNGPSFSSDFPAFEYRQYRAEHALPGETTRAEYIDFPENGPCREGNADGAR